MVKFITGGDMTIPPLALRRAPAFLRVVHDPAEDAWDALDQLTDTPELWEDVYAFRLVGPSGFVHLDYTERETGRRKGMTWATGEYVLVAPQPSAMTLRDTGAWRAWATEQQKSRIAETES